MKLLTVVEINLGNFGSTGAIINNIIDSCEGKNVRVLVAYPGSDKKHKKPNEYLICSKFIQKVSQKLYYYTGYSDCWNRIATKRFTRFLSKNKVDIIHLHNIHNNFLNLPILFKYIKKKNIKVIWTLHDCWSFTGRCPHFLLEKCEKWKNGCFDCKFPATSYPHTKIDKTKQMWSLKKKWFTSVERMTLVTPSKWLAGLVNESFLKKYPVRVINNGIDFNVFKPTESSFKKDYDIENKFIILGISFDWGFRKGLDVFIRLRKSLSSEYAIVLVGTNDEVDKQLPEGIISIHRTTNKQELAAIYTASDLFVNPTREDNFPTVNIESLACGTPVITYKTGGSPEIIDNTCGKVVECDDYESLEKEIAFIKENRPFKRESCIKRASRFTPKEMGNQYLELFINDN